MKTLIISTSLNPESLSLKCCQQVQQQMIQQNQQEENNNEVQLINLQDFQLNHVYDKPSKDAEKLTKLCESADNFIFGIAVYNYNVNDSFTSFVCNYMPKKKFGLYGLVLAAGGELSFLVTSAANQMLMTHNQMMPFPRFLYTTKKNWNEAITAPNPDFQERIQDFSADFSNIAHKLQ